MVVDQGATCICATDISYQLHFDPFGRGQNAIVAVTGRQHSVFRYNPPRHLVGQDLRSESLFSDFLGLGPPLRWLGRKLLFLWVRTTVLPADVGAQRLSSGAPVLYVLANNALSSRLVIEEVCARQGIPSLSDPPLPIDSEYRAVVFLRRLRGWFPRRGEPVQSPRLMRLIDAVHDDPALDVAVVPVSVFWGRSPDKEKSPLKLLFSESWAPAGRIRKMLIILVHGRQTLVQFSEPVVLRSFVDEAVRRWPESRTHHTQVVAGIACPYATPACRHDRSGSVSSPNFAWSDPAVR